VFVPRAAQRGVRPTTWEAKVKKVVCIFLLALALVSCANPVNRHTFQNYMAAGDQAARRGDLQLAKQNYSRALANVRIGHLSPGEEAIALFRYARILGNLCEHDEAEEAFIEANRLNEESKGVGTEATYASVVEIGQFNYDIGRYEKAVPYFDKALAIAEKYGLDNKHPASLSDVYTDYSDALKKTGNSTKASAMSAKASSLKAKVTKKEPEYTRYPKTCK
jgi:tetratricopeptide (TPR) repeat protein